MIDEAYVKHCKERGLLNCSKLADPYELLKTLPGNMLSLQDISMLQQGSIPTKNSFQL